MGVLVIKEYFLVHKNMQV